MQRLRLLLAVLPALVFLLGAQPTETTYDRLQDSVFTIEVHSGNRAAKGALGSGYLISPDGHIVTNYHVVGSYITDPDRYQIRVKNRTGEQPARLLRFDLINDLALIQATGLKAAPLPLASDTGAPGSPILAFGNPHGLGLSLIEGIFNGFAEKGAVDRMLLSIPLNSGMSGGPILNARQEVIGTNVSVMRDSNSLSFGVPVRKLRPLLDGPAVSTTRRTLLEEIDRQLRQIETITVARIKDGLAGSRTAPGVVIGAARSRQAPEIFECWNNTEQHKEEGLIKTRYGCNLGFTPSVEEIGPVTSVDFLIEHISSRSSRYGFYHALSEHAGAHHEVEKIDPNNGVFSQPECVAGRVRSGDLVWKLDTCLSAYVKHPGLHGFDLVATTVSRPGQAVYLAVHMKGFRLESFQFLTQRLLDGIQLVERP